MKKLLIGNEAVAWGLYNGGIGLVSSYPGTPSTEITEFLAKHDDIHSEWAPNEKVAMETAFGASLAGMRSACAMKHVGLNVAADPLFTMSYTGVTAGLVVCVADDPAMHSSQNEQDSRHYAVAAKVPMLEPSDSAEAYAFAKSAFELSEKYDTPVLLRMCTRIAHSQCVVDIGEREEIPMKDYVKQPSKYIMMPGYAKLRHPVVEERTEKLRELAENCAYNRVELAEDREIGIITSGCSYLYVKEVFGDSVSVLKIGMPNPLPEKMIRDFAAKVKKLYVIEELDPVIENHVKALGIEVTGKELFSAIGEFSQKTIRDAFLREGVKIEGVPEAQGAAPAVPGRPPMMCSGCPHRGMYYTLVKNKITVIGDIGCYTLGAVAPLNALDSTLCMGASVSGIHGFNAARGSGNGKEDRGGDRRQHLHAQRHDGAGEHRLQRHQLHRDHPGQLHYGHDGTPAEPHHRIQHQGGSGGEGGPGGPVPGPGHQPGAGGGSLRPEGLRGSGAGGAGGGGALGDHLPAALRAA